jgi:hypothetical protein
VIDISFPMVYYIREKSMPDMRILPFLMNLIDIR